MTRKLGSLCFGLLAMFLLCGVAHAAAPSEWDDSQVPTQQKIMGIMARVHQDGVALKQEGSKVAVFLQDELRAVATFDDNDGYYFYNISVRVKSESESGFVFKYYNPDDDSVYDLELPADHDPLTYSDSYGGFNDETFEFEPFILTLGSLQPKPFKVAIQSEFDNGTRGLDEEDELIFGMGTPTTKPTTPSMPSPLPAAMYTLAFTDSGASLATDIREFADFAAWTVTAKLAGGTKLTLNWAKSASGNDAEFFMPENYQFILREGDATLDMRETTSKVLDNSQSSEENTYNFTIYVTDAAQVPTVSYALSPAEANGQWRIDGGDWHDSEEVVETTIGDHTITFMDVEGYTTPASATITLALGDAYVGEATYTPAAPPRQTISFTLTPAEANGQWKLDGGDWNDSGAVVETTAGNHTVAFKEVEGYTTPNSLTITLAEGQEYIGNADYTGIAPTVSFTLTPAEANGQWQIDGGDWYDSGAVVETTAGNHTVAFKAIEGYTAPASLIITLTQGQAYTGNADYTAIAPIVCFSLTPAEANGQWQLDGGDWYDSGAEVETTAGDHTVTFMEVEGYVAPAPVTLTLANGDALERNAEYQALDDEAFLVAIYSTADEDNGLVLGMNNDAIARAAAQTDILAFVDGENRLSTDIRAFDETATWTVSVALPPQSQLSLDWSQSISGEDDPFYKMPATYDFTLAFGNEMLDMRTTTSLDLENPEDTEAVITLDITVALHNEETELHVDIDIFAGWNLIGIPFELNEESIRKLNGFTLMGFDAASQSYIMNLQDFEPGMAIWLFAYEAKPLTLAGTPVENAAAPLKKGWNLYSPLYSENPTLPDGYAEAWYWSPEGNRRYLETSDITLGQGFWIYME